jgi:hypothetical protein
MNIVIIIFSFLSLIHFIFKNYTIDQNGEIDTTRQSGFTTLRFAIFAGLIIFIMNIITVGNKCSENKAMIFHAFIAFIPWVFVYGAINLLFRTFPGWKSPFSNTFGYLFVMLLNANSLIIKLFNTLIFAKETSNDTNSLSHIEKKTLMTNIYKDQSIMLNVITVKNINQMWSSFFGSIEEAQQYKEQLYNVTIVKDKVSEFIWYILLSTIAYSISNRYISTIKCDKSSEYLEKTASKIDNIIKA